MVLLLNIGFVLSFFYFYFLSFEGFSKAIKDIFMALWAFIGLWQSRILILIDFEELFKA